MEIDRLYQEFLVSDGICIDSRVLKPNQIFFALSGSKVDGSLFAAEAIKSGARLAVVEDKHLADTIDNCIYTASTLNLLQSLARYHRNTLDIPVIGITGSVGKTTTKELLTKVLSSSFNVVATRGNLNNHIGVPLTVLSIKPETNLALVEMGANHIGEIAELCEICRPTYGLITKIGKAHLEGFGSMEGVIIAKSDLYRYIRDHAGTAFINDQDELLVAVSKGFEMNKIFVHDLIEVSLLESNPFLHLDVLVQGKTITIKTKLPGVYNIENLSMAIAVGHYFKIDSEIIKSVLESFRYTDNRSQHLVQHSNEFILDAYNANPMSMSAAIQSFHSWVTTKKKVLVLGEMKELGDARLKEHQKIIDLINTYSWYEICLVGPSFKEIGKESDHLYFSDVYELKAWYETQKFSDTAFLIKASRGMTLEKMIESIIPYSIH